MRSQVSQCESAEEGVDRNELQAYHTRTAKLALVQCECHTGKVLLQE